MDLDDLLELEVSDEIVAYFEGRAFAGNTLAEMVARRCENIRKGRAFISAPRDFDLEFKNLAWGGFSRTLEADTMPIICALAERYLLIKDRAIIMENQLQKVGDPLHYQTAKQIASYGNKLYHFVLSNSNYSVKKLLSEARSTQCDFGIFVQDVCASEFREPWNDIFLEKLVDNLRYVIIEIFDGDAYLLLCPK